MDATPDIYQRSVKADDIITRVEARIIENTKTKVRHRSQQSDISRSCQKRMMVKDLHTYSYKNQIIVFHTTLDKK